MLHLSQSGGLSPDAGMQLDMATRLSSTNRIEAGAAFCALGLGLAGLLAALPALKAMLSETIIECLVVFAVLLVSTGFMLIVSALIPTEIPLWMHSRKWANEEIVTKILRLSPLDAYWNKDDPQHTERVEYVSHLYAIAYPSKQRRIAIRIIIVMPILTAVVVGLWLGAPPAVRLLLRFFMPIKLL